MDELTEQFDVEARDLVQQAFESLLAMERDPADQQHLESLFRAIHTLKGSVALFDFGPMEAVLHRCEDYLSAARTGGIDIDAGFIDAVVAIVEWTEQCVEEIASTGVPSPPTLAQAAQLQAALTVAPGADTASEGLDASEPTPRWARDLLGEQGSTPIDHALIALRYEPHAECFFSGDDPLATVARVPGIQHLRISARDTQPKSAPYDPFRCNLVIEALSTTSLGDLQAIFRLIPDQVRLIEIPAQLSGATGNPGTRANALSRGGVARVNVERLDTLVTLTSELIAAKNRLRSAVGLLPDLPQNAIPVRRLIESQAEIDRLVGSLYTAVTRTRMIPIGQTFRRFPRLVRETASRLGKVVDLFVEGEAIEADREIVENVYEPLVHLVRNAIDHGIEAEAERMAGQKPSRGQIHLKAVRQGEQLRIELRDDGRGMSLEVIRARALSAQLATTEELERLSDEAVLQFIFLPGFSTSDRVTDVSGRGVGLDVVRASLSALGGRVELSSTLAQGTIFNLVLPISFSMNRLMVVEVGEECYGIPIEKIRETVRVSVDTVLPLRAGEAFVLRQQTIPLLELSHLLRLPQTLRKNELTVLIASVRGEPVGIAVDRIIDKADALMRPLSGMLAGTPGIVGSTLMGDGSILLVLDIEGLTS
ncbi:chemotaxis protein CheA [Ensifer canadensis]